MTNDRRVARRYANALFEVARKQGEVDAVALGLREVVLALESSRPLEDALRHPLLTQEKKRAILHGVFGQKVNATVERFLFLTVEKNRAAALPHMLEEFGRLVDKMRGEADALAVSAVALTPDQTRALEAALGQRFGVKVRLHTRVDESLLGGLIVRVGDKLIDASVATRLQSLNEQLKRVKVA